LANILDTQTVGEVLVVNTDTNPLLGGGTPNIPQGSIVITKDGSGIFYKTGNNNTDFIPYNSIGSPKTYFYSQDFEIGALPSGFSQFSSSGTTVHNNPQELGTLGICQIYVPSVTANARVGIQYSSGVNYLLRFTDSLYTELSFKIRFKTTSPPTPAMVIPAVSSVCMFGWINTNSMANGASGNTLAIMYDPSNISGYNTGGITNLFLLARATYGTPTANTIVDLGVLPDTNWRNFSIVYDNSLNEVRAYRDSILLTTLTNLSNVPAGSIRGAIPAGGRNSLQPTFYVANKSAPTAPTPTGMNLMVDKCSIYKIYS